MSELSGKHCLVTGGSGGIGSAISKALAARGASVTIHFNSNRERAEALAADITDDGGQVNTVGGNIAEPRTAEAVVQQAHSAAGHLDVLINCAGVTRNKLIADLGEEDWLPVMRTNLGGVIACTRAAAPHMLNGGSIINISSIMSTGGWRGNAAYAMSKAAIDSFTRTAAIEFARFGLRINAVLPGFAETELIADLFKNNTAQGILDQIPTKHSVPVEEIAELVVFLASPSNTQLTGSLITIDGASTATLLLGHPNSRRTRHQRA